MAKLNCAKFAQIVFLIRFACDFLLIQKVFFHHLIPYTCSIPVQYVVARGKKKKSQVDILFGQLHTSSTICMYLLNIPNPKIERNTLWDVKGGWQQGWNSSMKGGYNKTFINNKSQDRSYPSLGLRKIRKYFQHNIGCYCYK